MAKRTEIIEKLKDILIMADGGMSEKIDTFTEDSELIADLGLTSIGMLYIVIAIEEFYQISFDDVGFADFTTIKDVLDYIERKTA